MKNVPKIKIYKDVETIIARFLHYQIGNKAYYEILSVEFVKKLNSFHIRNKASILYWLALVGIDQSYIMKTLKTLISSYTEVFI